MVAGETGPTGAVFFSLLVTQDDFTRSIATEPMPGDVAPQLPFGPASNLETPVSYAEAHAGPYSHIWTRGEGKEFDGLVAAHTFRCPGLATRDERDISQVGVRVRGTQIWTCCAA